LVFITINLYNFILYILNNFLKTNLEKTIYKGFYRRNESVGIWQYHSSTHLQTAIFGRYFKHSPTALPTDLICRHLTVAATLTDEFTDEYIWSVSQTLTDKVTDGMYPSVKHDITDGIKSVGIFQAGNFFLARKFRL